MLFVKLTKTFKVHTDGGTDLDLHTDSVMDELLALESDFIRDADVSAALVEGLVSISIVAGAGDFDGAVRLADSTIRAAIHAAGGSTPDWKTVETRAQELEYA